MYKFSATRILDNLLGSVRLYQTERAALITPEARLKALSESRIRKQTQEHIKSFINKKKYITLGLAGRRGIGKTATVLGIREWFNKTIQTQLRHKHQFQDELALKKVRLKRLDVFLKSPTVFEEKGFLMSMFECLAREVDLRLSYILPPIHTIHEQRIVEKISQIRSQFHRMQIILLCLCVLLIAYWSFKKVGFLQPVKKTTISKKAQPYQSGDSLLNRWQWPDKRFFKKERNTLKDSTELAFGVIWKKLAFMDSVLSLRGHETLSQKWFDAETNVSLDSAKSILFKQLPEVKLKLDSLEKAIKTHLIKLDTVKMLYEQYNQAWAQLWSLQDVLEPYKTNKNLRTLLGFLSTALFILLSMLIILSATRPDKMNSKSYDTVRHEILLYQSTREALDRLHYNMSFSESVGSGIELSAPPKILGLKWGKIKSKQLTRAIQPFTIQSLIDEYKDYVRDVQMYVKLGLAESGFSKQDQESYSKILICIDELDKVLDSERLHNMLKSLKSVFELKGIFYILSISEDALESYELRGLQTKNEIDSSFTHILKLPPMEVEQCKQFYQNKGIKDIFWPLAIVNGAGVPRDMERIVDIIKHHSPEWTNAAGYKDYCVNFEKEAMAEKIRNHPRMSSIQKKESEEFIYQIIDSNILIDWVECQFLKEHFLECYPGSTEEGKKDYFNLLGLLQAFSVKIESIQLISQWMETHVASGKIRWWEQYAQKVDYLRQAVYLLGNSPFAARKELEKAKN